MFHYQHMQFTEEAKNKKCMLQISNERHSCILYSESFVREKSKTQNTVIVQ